MRVKVKIGNNMEELQMKKAFVLFCALLAFAACNIDLPELNTPVVDDNQEIKVNIKITRTEIEGSTKATIKTAWADGDNIFLFFQGVSSPKCLQMTYNLSDDTWTTTRKNSLVLSDIPESGTMTAIYLPYGKYYTYVAASGTGFTLRDGYGKDYSGHFYLCVNTPYNKVGETINGSINLTVAGPDNSNDRLVHFDVTGYTTGRSYNMYQDYMKPISLTKITAEGAIEKTIGEAGEAIRSFTDGVNSILSFSGVLDETAVGKEKEYWFSIRDNSVGTLYYRNAGNRTISANKYIGLGKLAGDGHVWTEASPGSFSVSDTKQVTIARSNLSYLGATGEGKPWQLMKFPWSTIEKNGMFEPASDKDFSLFGWATSGWDHSELTEDTKVTSWINYLPWSYSMTDLSATYPNNKYGYGPEGDINNAYPNGDWGYYNTTNGRHIYQYGGNSALDGTWRTLTVKEWRHLLANRPNGTTYTARTCDHIFAKAVVGDMAGLIIFPDIFSVPAGIVIKNENINFEETSPGSGTYKDIPYSDNTYTPLQWNKIEAAGAVFLPCAGSRNQRSIDATWVGSVGDSGIYSSSSGGTTGYVQGMNITIKFVDYTSNLNRYWGRSVRLVRDLN